ncbi:MAG TPA: ABC transporter permease [Bacillota bacterium]|jgi:ABC-type Na+ efflux pump permease subunit
MRKAFVIAKRELKEIFRDLNLAASVILPPVLLVGIFGFMMLDPIKGAKGMHGVENIPWGSLGLPPGATPQQMLVTMLTKVIAFPMFWIIPLAVTSIIAADSFAGEKERRTLEPLCVAPLTDNELFFGKILTSLILGLGASWLGFGIYTIFARIGTARAFGHPTFPDGVWLFSIFVFVPLLLFLGVSFAVFVSSRVSSYRTAQQVTAMLVIPIVGLMIGQTTGLMLITPKVMFVVAAIVAVIDIVLFRLATGLFRREAILTKW